MNIRIGFCSIISLTLLACSTKTDEDTSKKIEPEATEPQFQSLLIAPNENVTTSTAMSCIAVATDNDGDILEITYEWLDEDGNILRSDSQDFTPTPEANKPNDNIICRATLSDGTTTISEETSVSLINTLPIITDIRMTPDTDIFSNSEVTCEVTAIDGDLEELEKTFSWLKNGEIIENIVHTDTILLSSNVIQPEDMLSCKVTIQDPSEGSVEGQSDAIIQNTPPVIDNISLSPSLPSTQDAILCSVDTMEDLDLDAITLTYEWHINSILQTESSDVLEGPFAVGDRIACTIYSNDGREDGNILEEEIFIQNTPPNITAVTITPNENVLANSTLTCLAESEDFDGEEVFVSYSWSNSQGSILGTSSMLSLSASNPAVDEIITCTATAVDVHYDEHSLSTDIIVQNSLPQWSQQATISGSPYRDETLYCQAVGTDLNDGNLPVSYEWVDSNQNQLSSSNVLSITDGVSIGEILTCTATSTDNQGEMIQSSQNITILNSAPIIEVSLSETELYSDSLVSCEVTYSDLEGHAVDLSYRFFTMDGSEEIDLGDSSTLQLSPDIVQPSDVLYCSVTATDEFDAQTTQQISSVIKNTQPQFTQNASISVEGDVIIGNLLTCMAAGEDFDGEVTLTYTWKKGTTILSTESQWTIDGNTVTNGDQISCTAFLQDESNAVLISTDSIIIENSAPTIEVSLSETELYSDSLVSCEVTYSDLEGHAVDLSYRFFTMDGSEEIDLGDSSTLQLSPDIVQPSDVLYCSVTATDEFDAQTTMQISAVIQSTLPSEIDMTFDYDGQFPTVGDDLNCSYVEEQIRPDQTLTYERSWFFDGEPMLNQDESLQTDETITTTDVGEYECIVSVTDGLHTLEQAQGVFVDATLGSMIFDGSGYVQSSTTKIPTGDWTISFWIFVDANSFGEENQILGLVNQWDEDESNTGGLQINYVWDNEIAAIEVLNGGSSLTATLPTHTAQWVHVVVTKEGSNRAIYIDGSWQEEDNSGFDITDNSNLRLGYRNEAFFEGRMSQFHLWTEALSVDTIGDIYENNITTPTTLSYMGGIQNIIDASGNENHGEVIGIVLLDSASPFSDSDDDGIFDKDDIYPYNEFVQDVQIFLYTGSDQEWIIPEDQNKIIVQIWGAAGGGSNAEGFQHAGGAGAFVEAEMSVTGGSSLRLEVGQGGGLSSEGANSSYPNGGSPGLRSGYVMGGGGGRSAVYLVEELQQIPLVIAGGGGGAGGTGWGDSQSTSGGAGGEIGENGLSLTNSIGCEGIGGTQTESIEQVCEVEGGTFYGPAGNYLSGGNGRNFDDSGNCGGGGGDGYYGGGAGALHAGGGGGSSYVDAILSNNITFATSEDGTTAPMLDLNYYMPNVAQGIVGNYGGNGLIVIFY